MLNDFDNTLKQLLIKRVPLDPNEVDISFECPKREWSANVLKPTVNLYLYDLRENMEFRRSAWTVEHGQDGRNGGMRRPPVFVDLSYFITSWARNVADEHHLLWRVMAALMRESEIDAGLLQGTLKEVGPPVKTVTAQADGILRNPGEFWSALDNDLKPAVTYTATLGVDLDVLVGAPLVLTKVIDVGKLVSQGKPGQPAEADAVSAVRERFTEIGGVVRSRAARKGDTPQPIAEAVIAFPQLGITVETDASGRYRVAQIPEGKHRVSVTPRSGTASESEVSVPAAHYDLEV
jgi:hypothetical protein